MPILGSILKRLVLLCSLGSSLASVTLAQEFEHVQIGVFANYLQLSQTNSDFAGLGGRVGVPAWRHIQLEGDLSYDFDASVISQFQNVIEGRTSEMPIDLWIVHGEFGPKLNLGHKNIHTFVFLKSGFIDYRFTKLPTTIAGLESALKDLPTSGIHLVVYPGVGLEGHVGHLGLRLDVGDEIAFSSGAHNNLRVAFGPFIRF